jgi:hypothetical protein
MFKVSSRLYTKAPALPLTVLSYCSRFTLRRRALKVYVINLIDFSDFTHDNPRIQP